MVHCTITLLLYGIVVLYHYYNMAIRHRREKKPDGDGHREQEKEGWSLGGLADFA